MAPEQFANQSWDHDRNEPGKHRQQIKLGRDRKYDRAEQEIDGEDVHCVFCRYRAMRVMPAARGSTRGLRLLRADGH